MLKFRGLCIAYILTGVSSRHICYIIQVIYVAENFSSFLISISHAKIFYPVNHIPQEHTTLHFIKERTNRCALISNDQQILSFRIKVYRFLFLLSDVGALVREHIIIIGRRISVLLMKASKTWHLLRHLLKPKPC